MYLDIFFKISELSIFLAGIISCFLYRKLPNIYKLISIYIWWGVCINCLGIYFKNTGYNLFLVPIYSFIELTIFSYIYLYIFFKKTPIGYKGLILLAHSLILLDFLFLCDLFNAKTFDAFNKVVSDVTIILLCLRYYSSILKAETPINKEFLLLNSVFIGYFSINCLIFLSMNFLVNESRNLVIPFWSLNALSILLLYMFFIYMIWQHGKTQKISPSG